MSQLHMGISFQPNRQTVGVSISGGVGEASEKKVVKSVREDADIFSVRRTEARKKAMKIVSDAFDGEKEIDRAMQELRDKTARLQEETGEKNGEIAANREAIGTLKDAYGVEDDSREQKDLTLLMKRQEGAALTKEERERLAEIDRTPRSEYQERVLEINERSISLNRQIDRNKAEIRASNMALTNIRLERLKSDPMREAEAQADAVMEAADQQLVGALWNEAKDHIDEAQEAAKREAEERAAQKEAQEEKRDHIREKTEEIREKAEKIQEELDDMLDKLKLLNEDVKGAKVDRLL